MTTWESTFVSWSGPPSATEEDKCERTVRMVRNAIEAEAALSRRSIRVFAQGSYRNDTNVRQESDVDVGILCADTFFYDFTFAPDLDASFLSITPATYSYPTFANEVGTALADHFGSPAVTRGTKAFDIHETTSRLDADALPCFEYRQYEGSRQHWSVTKGTAFLPANGVKIVNWPEQQHENGVLKNKATSGRFKKTTRVLKRLRYLMDDEGVAVAKPIPSFLIECLIWNVPDHLFANSTLTEDLRASLSYIWNSIERREVDKWREVSALKLLFHASQAWSTAQAQAFVAAAGNRVGFW